MTRADTVVLSASWLIERMDALAPLCPPHSWTPAAHTARVEFNTCSRLLYGDGPLPAARILTYDPRYALECRDDF